MLVELLDAELVRMKIKENGWTRKHLIAQLGLGRTGYHFLRGEWLPKNGVRKTLLIKKLAGLIGVRAEDLLLRFETTNPA